MNSRFFAPHLRRARALALLGCTGLPLGCGDGVEVGEQMGPDANVAGAGGSLGGTGGVAGTTGGGVGGACVIRECQAHVYQCGDCLDDDGDALIDDADPDCLGACDNTEDSYYGGIPGQSNAPCIQDCYFDQDTGAGNDDCRWSHACDPLSVAPDYPPSGDVKCEHDPQTNLPGVPESCATLLATQSPECAAACGPLTPNGCDCFGCCELPAGSGSHVWLGSTANGAGSCSAASAADPTLCHPCTQVPGCANDCAPCELCVGKPTLPAECAPDAGAGGGAGAPGQCPEAYPPCGLVDQAPCASNQYCITGCCIPVPG